MARRRKNHIKLWNGGFVLIPFSIIDSNAFHYLKPPARVILTQIIRRCNGNNNGRIPYSCREAANECNISINTAARAFKQLETSGIIKCITLSNFDSRKKMAREWSLTYWPVDNTPASGEWKLFKTKPSTKNDSYSFKRDTNVFKLENLKIV